MPFSSLDLALYTSAAPDAAAAAAASLPPAPEKTRGVAQPQSQHKQSQSTHSQSQSSPSPSTCPSRCQPSRFGPSCKSCQSIILSWSGMPSASIPKTRFLPTQNTPLPPSRPASDPLLSCELCAVTIEKHHRLYPPRNHQATPKRVGDARRILPNPTLNHRRADQQHCQKRLLDSGTRPAWPQGMIEIRGVWAILTSPSPSKGLGRDPLPFTSVVPR